MLGSYETVLDIVPLVKEKDRSPLQYDSLSYNEHTKASREAQKANCITRHLC